MLFFKCNYSLQIAHSNISEVVQAVLSLDRDARSTKEASMFLIIFFILLIIIIVVSLLVQKVEKMTEILSEKTSTSASSDSMPFFFSPCHSTNIFVRTHLKDQIRH